jgi:outer membrane protein assembly factor BamA
MRPLRALFLAPALLCLASLSAFAQYTVKRITFTGTTPYADSDLEATSGLHAGLAFTSNDLQAAAQRLVDTGAFDDVQVALAGPFKAISVNFTLKAADPDHILKASFANLIWWQPEELQTALHAKLPLYNGTVPESGNQQDATQAALQQLLTEKGITATLINTIIEPTPGQPQRVLEFKVVSPEVRLHSAKISGASPTFAPALDKIASQANGSLYNEGITGKSLTQQILNIYRNVGNLDAALADLHRTPQSSSASRIDVDLTASIQEGHPFRISQVQFAGTPIMSAADFTHSLKLHPEDIASRKALLESLKPLSEAYRNQGYLDATIDPQPTLDTATQHVSYAVSVIPRGQYHMRSITPLNLSPAQRKDFDRGWKLQSGDLYNEAYVTNFLTNNTALITLNGCSATFKTIADPDTHLVDVTMTFIQPHNTTGR